MVFSAIIRFAIEFEPLKIWRAPVTNRNRLVWGMEIQMLASPCLLVQLHMHPHTRSFYSHVSCNCVRHNTGATLFHFRSGKGRPVDVGNIRKQSKLQSTYWPQVLFEKLKGSNCRYIIGRRAGVLTPCLPQFLSVKSRLGHDQKSDISVESLRKTARRGHCLGRIAS